MPNWKPGSKVTASTLAGMATSLFWEVSTQFALIPNPRPTLVSTSVLFVMAAVAYMKVERAL